eukprot:358638-Prorocentrum_minimum.AAC.1
MGGARARLAASDGSKWRLLPPQVQAVSMVRAAGRAQPLRRVRPLRRRLRRRRAPLPDPRGGLSVCLGGGPPAGGGGDERGG